MVKFNKSLDEYEYILSFDLAKHSTGYACVNLHKHSIVKSGVIVQNDNSAQNYWYNYYSAIKNVIENIIQQYGNDNVMIIKEKMPCQAGKFTTIASLQALAMAHSAWEIACGELKTNVYDYDGVHAASEKAWARSVLNIKNPTKEDVADAVKMQYTQSDCDWQQHDITDSLAVIETLICHKWNNDILERIRELKRDIKTYKSENKKQELLQNIERLQTLIRKESK